MEVYTVGGSGARSASARTSSEVKGSRFLRRMLTTSVAVQPHSPISTSSMGLGAVLSLAASSTTAWPLLACPRKRSLSVHLAKAVIMESAANSGRWKIVLHRHMTGSVFNSASKLPRVVGLRLGVDQYAKQLGGCLFEADFQFGGHVVHPRQRQIVRHGHVAGKI